jgi:hypothetical protein
VATDQRPETPRKTIREVQRLFHRKMAQGSDDHQSGLANQPFADRTRHTAKTGDGLAQEGHEVEAGW